MQWGDSRVESRFWDRLVPCPATGCWLYCHDGKTDRGYALFATRENGRTRQWRVHKYAYTRLIGIVSGGLVLDHLCGNRSCCNPWHLEPVTAEENSRRVGTRRKVCVNGHILALVGVTDVHYPSGTPWRRCNACATAARVRLRERHPLRKDQSMCWNGLHPRAEGPCPPCSEAAAERNRTRARLRAQRIAAATRQRS